MDTYNLFSTQFATSGPPNFAEEENEYNNEAEERERERGACRQGHRASLVLRTSAGGCICLVCFSNLFSHCSSGLAVHRAYALSQLSRALDDAMFATVLRQNQRHFLVSPLSQAIVSSRQDQTLANDITHVITKLCKVMEDDEDDAANILVQDFIHHVLLDLASSAFAWTPSLAYALHCLGLLLELHCNSSNALPSSLTNQRAFMLNLVSALRLPGDEIRGEILFVLYKLLNLEHGLEELMPFCPHFIHLVVEALLKTESDELRTNCLAVLTMLAKQQVFHISFANSNEEKDSPMETENITDTSKDHESLTYGSFVRTFAEAIKGPLLSSDVQVQISTLELVHYYAFRIEGVDIKKELGILLEEGTVDYIFEILRVSDNNEPLVIWCIRILSLLSTAEQAFLQRFAVGFTAMIKVLGHVAGIAFHPVHTETLLLISTWLSNSSGIISTGQAEDLLLTLTKMLNQYGVGDLGLSSEAFNAVCSAFIALLRTPSCCVIKGSTVSLIHTVLKNAISYACDSKHDKNMLYCLYFFKETFVFTLDISNRGASDMKASRANIVEICEIYLLPSIGRLSENQETIRALLQTFSFILRDTNLVQTKNLAEKLAVSSWFSFSFECLARFPVDDVRDEVFLVLSFLIDQLAGDGMGEVVREASCNLPLDPVDLLFLLGQISCHSSELCCSQAAIISILHTSYIYGDRIADDIHVLASLEQYILVNASSFLLTTTNHAILIQISELYALIRDTKMNCPLSYSVEAEKLLLRLIADCECNLFSSRTPKAVLRWVFQRDEIQDFLMVWILNLCKRIYNLEKEAESGFQRDDALENQNSGCPPFDIILLAELIEEEDCGTSVLVLLLNQIIERHLDDLQAVLHVLMRIIEIFPSTSNCFCANGILTALHRSYFVTISSETLISVTMLVFSILCFSKFEMEEDFWLGISNQVMHILVGKLKDKNSTDQEAVILFSVLALILQKSKPEEGLLIQSSRAIVVNSHLGSSVESIIENASAKGAALAQLDEQTSSGQILISVLVYHLYWLRRFHTILQENIHNKDFLFMDYLQKDQALSSNILDNNYTSLAINISCKQLCQLLYFGSPIVKLIASYSIVEVFSQIAEGRMDGNNFKRELKCSPYYLHSILNILQGFVLHENIHLAKNVASCIYWLLGCECLSAQQQKTIQSSNWYRLILEELTLYLATPNHLSQSVMSCPAAYIAIAFLSISPAPEWIESVFSSLCITSIIDNLSSQKPATEIVLLFRSLLSKGYIEVSHIRNLHHLFQDFRRLIFMENTQDHLSNKHVEKWSYTVHECNKMMVDLIMSASIDPVTGSWIHRSDDDKEMKSDLMKLVAEIDKFLQESAIYVK